ITTSCGSAQSVSLSDGCSAWSFEACIQGLGEEQLYQITPATTDNYVVNVLSYGSASGDYTEFAYKDASLGCDQNNFTCIGSTNAAGVLTTLSLTGGTTYYFLLDRSVLSSGGDNNVTWQLDCPVGPCTAIIPYSGGCATQQNITLAYSGGYWNGEVPCGYNSSGAEQIYSFVAPATGSYNVETDSWVGEYVSFGL